ARTVGILNRLSSMGVTLAIDDFGTGYSSLAYLKRLPVDELKIDRSFVQELARGQGTAVVQTIIGLGHELGLRVVAEGVESFDMLDALHGLGCDMIQGHHVSKPLPAIEFEHWLAGAGAGVAKASSGSGQSS
ncbi:MAG TPA: EAL domain-containing protein, partial [Acidimicrobiales bacterium]